MESPRREIAAGIEAALATQARLNELRVSYVRIAAVAFKMAIDTMNWVRPEPIVHVDGRSIAFDGAWLGASLMLLVVLRRGWASAQASRLLPLIDGLLLFSLGWDSARSSGPRAFALALLAPLGIASAMLIVSGGLRLRRSSVALTTAIAIIVFDSLATRCGMGRSTRLYAASFLGVIGLVSYWMNMMVRNALENDIGRRTLGHFLPSPVIQRAYGNPIKLAEPQSVVATVLFSDLRGFTTLAEGMAPAEVLEFLNEIQGELSTAVQAAGGTVDKFIGDGMLAVFGAFEGSLKQRQDHALRAIEAARAIRLAIDRLNSSRRTQAQREIRIGIGIHSGPVVAGCLGSGARLEFTVIGDTVNAAARLEALSKELGVDTIVSNETARLAGLIDLRSLGTVSLRGRVEQIEIHAL